MPLRRLLCLPVVALALVPAAPAAADQAIAEIGRQSPAAAYGGWQAWSRYDMWVNPSHKGELLDYATQLIAVQQIDGTNGAHRVKDGPAVRSA